MNTTRATVRDLRRHNRGIVLSTLFFDGPRSRHELSGLTGLSAATVSNVTGELLRESLLVEAGQVESDGGRPRILLRVNPRYGHVVGIDLGEGGVRIELFDLAMTRLAMVRHALSDPLPDPIELVALVSAGLRQVIADADVDEHSVLGVGIGVPGTVERTPSGLVHAQTIGWQGVALEKLLREEGVGLPLLFDNGAKTQGQAEQWFGAGRGAQHAVVLLVGSGVGAAVITDGSTYRGATSSAGEWGHTTINYGGRRCRCGAHGCLEAYVGAQAILERYHEARGDQAVPGADVQGELDRLLAATDADAVRVLDETADYLGAGIASLVNLFNPERIVLGGWAGIALGERLLPRIRAATAAHALHRPFEQTSIELSELGQDAVAVGAATLPVAVLLSQQHSRDLRLPAGAA